MMNVVNTLIAETVRAYYRGYYTEIVTSVPVSRTASSTR